MSLVATRRGGVLQALSRAALAVIVSVTAVPAAGAAEIFVNPADPNSSDGGDGSVVNPFKTISAALAAHHDPGTTIHVFPGIYPEKVTIPASGTSGMPIYLLAENRPGNPVVIEGADSYASPDAWTAAGGGVWRASGVAADPGQVLVDGVRAVPDTVAPASLAVNHWVFVTGQGVYLNLGGDNPGSHDTWISARSHGFLASGKSWIDILGFTIHRQGSRGIQFSNGCTNVEVTQNTVSFSGGYGIQASGGSQIRVAENTVFANGDHGIGFISGTTQSVIEDNESYGNARPDVRAANGVILANASNNTVRRNRLHDNQDTGLQMSTGSSANLAYQNLSWKNGDHGFDHLGATNNVHIGDVAYGNFKDGFSFEGGSSGISIHDCIAVENGLTTNEFDLWVDTTSSIGFQSDDNLFWNSTAQKPIKFVNTQYASVGAFSAATGLDARSIQADPAFVDPATGDFHLQAGSPAIDNANSGVANWPATDAAGLPPIDDPATANAGVGPVSYADRGAFEFQAATTDVPAGPRPGGDRAEGVSPNPVRQTAALTFVTTRPGPIQASIVDPGGRLVRRLADAVAAEAGRHVIPFDLAAAGGTPLDAGVYFYRVLTADGWKSGRFVVTR